MSDFFLSEDREKAVAFGNFIHKHAKWEFTSQEAIEFTKHLAWYQGLVKKIESHIFELQKVHQAPEQKPEAKADKKAK